MKYDEALRTPANRLAEARDLGRKLQELRIAHEMTQSEVAARAGISRSTAVLIEQGDESRTLSQLLRYLNAIEPVLSLFGLLQGDSVAVRHFRQTVKVQRVYKTGTRRKKPGAGDTTAQTRANETLIRPAASAPSQDLEPRTPPDPRDKYDF